MSRSRGNGLVQGALLAPLCRDEGLTRVRQLGFRAALSVGAIVLALLAWSAVAPLNGAVIAQGIVKTERDRKTVRHQEGGIVREILVGEGQRVKAGQPLMVIGDVRTDALLDLQVSQRNVEAIRLARLESELEFAVAFVRPPGIAPSPAIEEHERRERALFTARRNALQDQEASLKAQMQATEAQISALSAQIVATRQGLSLANEELAVNRGLVEGGFIQRTRLLALERGVADYEARDAEQAAEHALARQRLGDLQSRLAQVRNQYRQQAAEELKIGAERLRTLDEQLRPARDLAERQFVRAPVDGEVMSMMVAAPGTVVGPRDALLDVVPALEALVVEARIAVEDVEHIRYGVLAEVRLSAYDYRTTPLLAGRVTAVSADRVQDERSGLAWYLARIEVDKSGLSAYPGAVMLPGMPAEVFVTTEPRTLLDYVLRPLSAFARRGMREP